MQRGDVRHPYNCTDAGMKFQCEIREIHLNSILNNKKSECEKHKKTIEKVIAKSGKISISEHRQNQSKTNE